MYRLSVTQGTIHASKVIGQPVFVPRLRGQQETLDHKRVQDLPRERPARLVTALASVTESRPWRQANASSAAWDSSSLTPSCAWNSRCSSLSSSSRTRASWKAFRPLSFRMTGGTLAEASPVPEDGPHAGARLLAQPDSAKSGDDRGIADFLRRRIQQFVDGSLGVPRIPEHRPVTIEPDERGASMVPVVLVNELVDDRLPKDT